MNQNYLFSLRVEFSKRLVVFIIPALVIFVPKAANGQQPESLLELSHIQAAVYLHLFSAGEQESAKEQLQIHLEQLLRKANIPLLENPSPRELVSAWFHISVRI